MTITYADVDTDLLERAGNGDEAAFTTLYRRHHAAVRRLAYTYRLEGDPDELVDATFAEVVEGLRQRTRPPDQFRPYLFATVRRLAGADPHSAAPGIAGEVPATVVAVAGRLPLGGADRSTITAAFAALPERWQVVAWHAVIDACDADQLAHRLGIPPAAAAAQGRRAHAKLRQAYLDAQVAAAPRPGCAPHRTRLAAHLRGALPAADAEGCRAHVDRCDACRTLLTELGEVEDRLAWSVAPLFPRVAPAGGAVTSPLAVGVLAPEVRSFGPDAPPLPFRSGLRGLGSGSTPPSGTTAVPAPVPDPLAAAWASWSGADAAAASGSPASPSGLSGATPAVDVPAESAAPAAAATPVPAPSPIPDAPAWGPVEPGTGTGISGPSTGAEPVALGMAIGPATPGASVYPVPSDGGAYRTPDAPALRLGFTGRLDERRRARHATSGETATVADASGDDLFGSSGSSGDGSARTGVLPLAGDPGPGSPGPFTHVGLRSAGGDADDDRAPRHRRSRPDAAEGGLGLGLGTRSIGRAAAAAAALDEDDRPHSRRSLMMGAAAAAILLVGAVVAAGSMLSGGGGGESDRDVEVAARMPDSGDDEDGAPDVRPSTTRAGRDTTTTAEEARDEEAAPADDEAEDDSSESSSPSSSSSSTSSSSSSSSTSSSTSPSSSNTTGGTAPSTTPTTGGTTTTPTTPGVGTAGPPVLQLAAPSWVSTDDGRGTLQLAVTRPIPMMEPSGDEGATDDMAVELTVAVSDTVRLLTTLDDRCTADVNGNRTIDGPIACTLDVPAEGESAIVSIMLGVSDDDVVAEVTAALDGEEFGSDSTTLAPPAGTASTGIDDTTVPG